MGAGRVSVVVGVLVLAGLIAVPGTAGTRGRGQTADTFRSADASAACSWLRTGAVACRARTGGAALVLHQDGQVEIGKATVRWSRATPVLRTRQNNRRSMVTCTGEAGGLACTTANGGRIDVSAAGAGALVPPVTYP